MLPDKHLTAELEPVRAILRETQWPGVEEGLSYGAAALKCRGKFLCRIREPGVLVVLCEMEEKETLMRAEPEIYYQIPHYFGYPAVLVRLAKIDPDDLRDMLERSWRSMATAKMIAEYEARTPEIGTP